ncbi:MAG: hypothetical protein IKU42_03805 [Oscillospiraceae bacterium]|nr:hypothetical protein [Oscillospiraceae bacterium]
MFKKLFAVLFTLLVLCSCGAADVPENIPEEDSSIAEEQQEAKQEFNQMDYKNMQNLLEYPEELNSTPCGYEGGNPYKAEGVEIPAEVEEILFRIRRTGEFSTISHIDNEKVLYAALMALPMVSKYDLEPELQKELEPLFEEIGDDCFYPVEWVGKTALKIFGAVRYNHETLEEYGFVYHKEAMVYTPPHKQMESVFPYILSVTESEIRGTDWTAYDVEFIYLTANNLSGYEIGDSGEFIECDSENGENIFDKPEFKEFIESGKDRYTARIVKQDGKYNVAKVEKNMTIPEVVAKHIEILNELKLETFGMDVDWDNYYVRLYNEKPYGKDFDYTALPDALENASVFRGVSVNNETKYKGYYIDTAAEAYLADNFTSREEVFDYLCQWIAPNVIEESSFGSHVMEFDGKVYLLRHSRGYGTVYYGDTVITEQTETEMTAETIMYQIGNEECGIMEVKFEKIDGRWIVVSIEENYY